MSENLTPADLIDIETIDRAVAVAKGLHAPIRELLFPVDPWTDPETGEDYWIVADGGFLREPPPGAERVTVMTESGVDVEVLRFPVEAFEEEP